MGSSKRSSTVGRDVSGLISPGREGRRAGIGVGIQYEAGVAAPRGTSLGFYVGLDLGQARDLSAAVILERIWRRGLVDGRGRALLLYHIRYAMRYERGTPYPDVVQHVAETFYDNEDIFYYEDNVPRSSRRPPQIAIDATGVGATVRDRFVKAGVRRPYLRP